MYYVPAPVEQMQQDLNSGSPVLRLRVSPGVLRNIRIMRQAGFAFTQEQPPEVAETLGLSSGQLGEWGFPKLVSLLRLARLQDGSGLLGGNRVEVTVQIRPFGPTPNNSPVPIEGLELADLIGLRLQTVREGQWKDYPKQLPVLQEVLAPFRVIYLGSKRVEPFARSLGVAGEDFLCIPDHNSYPLIPKLVQSALGRLQEHVGPAVLLHSASLVGVSWMLELSKREVPFFGFDLGLAGAIMDLEYLACRPWFTQFGPDIIEAARKMRERATQDLRTMDGLEHLTIAEAFAVIQEFGEIWVRSINEITDDPKSTISRLKNFLDQYPYDTFPLANMTLMLWLWRFEGYTDEPRLRQAGKSRRLEPRAATAAMLATAGDTHQATNITKLVDKESPFEEWLPEWHEIISRNTSPQVRDWDSTMTMSGRDDYGSRLNWSLYGDLPHAKNSSALPDLISMTPNKAAARDARTTGSEDATELEHQLELMTRRYIDVTSSRIWRWSAWYRKLRELLIP